MQKTPNNDPRLFILFKYENKVVLDLKLIRENPTLVENNLSRRGKDFNIAQLNGLTLKKKRIRHTNIKPSI